MTIALRKPMTREEFFAWAEGQEGRYEFDGFQPVAMTGGTNRHGIISRNLNGQLYLRLRGQPCQSMPPEGGGVATVGNTVRYPDAVVTCSPLLAGERHVPDPVVVFEVISPSSVQTDQVTKPIEYEAVLSIKRYVLIEQARMMVTVHSRQHDEPWTKTPVFLGVLDLPETGIEIPLSDIYDGVVFSGL